MLTAPWLPVQVRLATVAAWPTEAVISVIAKAIDLVNDMVIPREARL
jgi:hypothetical protein